MIILIMLLIVNTYAWFIYATKVSTGLTAHVTSWNVQFETGDGGTSTNIAIDLDRIYPGMDNYEKIIEVKNRGEVSATLSYNIESIKVLGMTYSINDGYTRTRFRK